MPVRLRKSAFTCAWFLWIVAQLVACGDSGSKAAEGPSRLAAQFILSAHGVALRSFAGAPVTKATLTILDTGPGDIAYVATGDAAWLRLTPSHGSTGADLVVDADISALAPGLHEATVTISADLTQLSNTADAPAPVAFTVALYVSATVAATLSAPLNFRPEDTLFDPIRPYAYITHENSRLEVYDTETGLSVGSHAFPYRDAIIAADGEKLFAFDVEGAIRAFELPNLSESASYPLLGTGVQMLLTRCARGNLLFVHTTDGLTVFDEASTEVVLQIDRAALLWNSRLPAAMVASPRGDSLYVLERGAGPPGVYAFDIVCSRFTAPAVKLTQRALRRQNFSPNPPRLSADGSLLCIGRTCLAAETLTEHPPSSTALAHALQGTLQEAFVRALLFGASGRCYLADGLGRIFVFDADWQQIGAFEFMSPPLPGSDPTTYQLGLSSDERRMTAVADKGELRTFSVPDYG